MKNLFLLWVNYWGKFRIFFWLIMSIFFTINQKYHFITIFIDSIDYMLEKNNLELDHKIIDPKIFIKEDNFIKEKVEHTSENNETFLYVCVGILITITIFSITGIIYVDNLE